jgi:hypothetical protein
LHERYEIELEGVSALYVRKLLGEEVDLREFLGFPRLCVLICREFGVWPGVEDSVVSDSVAAYFYAKLVVGGRLSPEMHGRLMLGSFEGMDYGLRRYIEDFA